MKKTYLSILAIFFFATSISAQDSKFSASLSYPIAFGDNFLADHSGVADLGMQYRFIKIGAVKLGISANTGYYTQSTKLSTVTLKESVFLIQPRAYGEIDMAALLGFRPFFGLGYSLVNSKINFENGQQDDESDSTGGLNVNLGVAYDFANGLFASLQYDYLSLSRDNPNQDNDFFKNASIIKLGVGYRF